MSISIHAPRVGSDGVRMTYDKHMDISIHAPRVGSDGLYVAHFAALYLFQSTLPVWGATPWPSWLRR